MTEHGRLSIRQDSEVIGERIAKPAHKAGSCIIQIGCWEWEE